MKLPSVITENISNLLMPIRISFYTNALSVFIWKLVSFPVVCDVFYFVDI